MLKKGVQHTSRTIVSTANTARTMGSGDLDVFATPSMVALMENAAMLAVVNELPEGASTVGAQMNTSHIKPSPMGEEITATATLEEADDRKLTFRVVAHDSKGMIGEGTHIRFIVDKARFLSRIYPASQ